MKRSRVVLLTALIVMAALGLFISVMSVMNAKGRGSMVSFSLGGKAELRNTIEIPLSELDSLVMKYGSKNIDVYLSQDENVTIKEYLYSDNPKAAATVSYTGDKEAVVTGGEIHSIVIFGFWFKGERIEVYVPEKGLAKLSLETGSGNIRTDFDDALSYNKKGNQAEGEVGAGAPQAEIHVKAGSGNVRVSY